MSRTNVAPIVYTTLLAATIYWATLAPGLTWSNHGADGGELIAAAMQNGVPHPPGYPFYILLLQVWIWFGELVFPLADRAWLGNLLSAFCAALSVGLTASISAHLLSCLSLQQYSQQQELAPAESGGLLADEWFVWGWSAVVALAWALAPLFWGQALITEVYALHLLLTIFLAWSLFVKDGHPLFLIPSVALGISHHLTFVLLLPAALYWLVFRDDVAWVAEPNTIVDASAERPLLLRLSKASLVLGIGGLLGALFYLRIPLAASSGPPPINWGYADSWSGFLWLISADAYRPYLFGLPTSSILQRVSAWAYMTTAQYTLVGLAFALLGLSYLDRNWSRLRTFGLLWSVPICVYAIGYHTRDSEIYLLPFFWMVALWLGVGLWFGSTVVVKWLARWDIRFSAVLYPLVGFVLVLGLGVVRWGDVSLRGEQSAIAFLEDARLVFEPQSIVYSSSDAETFALWYGAWGTDEPWRTELAERASTGEFLDDEPILINSSLLQFEWYQRLLRERYADVDGIGELTLDLPLSQAMIDNAAERPIYFSEEPSFIDAENLEVVGRFWRFVEKN